MSILKKLIATASVFALASASLVSASAATTLTFTNKPSDTTNYSVCVYKKGTAPSGAVKAESFSVPTLDNNGNAYIVYINNSSSCFPLVSATNTAEFPLVNGHQTEVALANYVIATAPTTSVILYNELPTLTSVVTPKGTYSNTTNATVCQGNTGSIKVTFNDINTNELSSAALSTADLAKIQGTPVVDTSVRGQLTVTVFPTTTSVANTNGFTLDFNASDAFTPVATSPAPTITVAPAAVTKSIRFSVVTDCASTTVASSSSSVSSMSSSSMSSSSATVVASSTVAASSKAPTEVAAAPMADSAKGSTVRTGGNN